MRALLSSVLLRTAEEDDVHKWERSWRKRLARDAEDDATWNWRRHVERGRTLDGYLSLAAVSADRLEGLMSLSIAGSLCDPGEDLVYVEYVAVAPWNRRRRAPPEILGLGRALLRTAVRVSVEMGYSGRIGLHSKPVSEGFYRDKLRLIDLGPKMAEDGKWVYFEATPEVAKGLL